MLFPLGLGSRLPTAPLMCLFMSVIIVGYSIVSFPVMKRFDERIRAEVEREDFRATAASFFGELCELRLHDTETCSQFAGLIENHDKKPKMPESADVGARMLELAKEFGSALREPDRIKDAAVRNLPSFAALKNLYDVRRAQGAQISRELGLLTAENNGFVPLLKAQFSHAGWIHLLSNLVVLILLGIYLEARVGAVWFLGIFLISGILGMLGHLIVLSDPSRPLLGASAGVAGVMGAFLAFFWRQPMKVWLSWGLVVNRVIYIPSWLVLGPLFILHDVTGALSTDDGVAHLAHLSGLIVGAAIGFLHLRLAPVAPGMLYEDEEFFTSKLAGIQTPAKRLEIAERILSWNPNNLTALRTSVLTRVELPFEFEPKGLAEPLTSYLAISLRQGLVEGAYAVLREMPRRVPLADQILRLSVKNRLTLAEHALGQGDWLTAVRVYDSALIRSLKTDLREKIVSSVDSLYDHVHPAPEDLKDLRLSSELKYKFVA